MQAIAKAGKRSRATPRGPTVYEAQNQVDKAAADLRRATAAGAEAHVRHRWRRAARMLKLQQLSKRIPCDGAGQSKVGETCLQRIEGVDLSSSSRPGLTLASTP